MTKTEKQNKIKLILEAREYRSGEDSINNVYMGSMAHAKLYSVLGMNYGGENPRSMEEVLNDASDATVKKAYEVCRWVIEYMQANPVKTCECCGQIIRVK